MAFVGIRTLLTGMIGACEAVREGVQVDVRFPVHHPEDLASWFAKGRCDIYLLLLPMSSSKSVPDTLRSI